MIHYLSFNLKPKCVQSTRFGGGHSFEAADVRAWKNEIKQQLRQQLPANYQPWKGAVTVRLLKYTFKLPKSYSPSLDDVLHYLQIDEQFMKKADRYRELQRVLEAGEKPVPYFARADLMDNLNKGLFDCMTGIVYEDDRFVWRNLGATKQYGPDNNIYIELITEGDNHD